MHTGTSVVLPLYGWTLSHPLPEVLQHSALVMRELGNDARPVVHLLLQGEVPEVTVLLVDLPRNDERTERHQNESEPAEGKQPNEFDAPASCVTLDRCNSKKQNN